MSPCLPGALPERALVHRSCPECPERFLLGLCILNPFREIVSIVPVGTGTKKDNLARFAVAFWPKSLSGGAECNIMFPFGIMLKASLPRDLLHVLGLLWNTNFAVKVQRKEDAFIIYFVLYEQDGYHNNFQGITKLGLAERLRLY